MYTLNITKAIKKEIRGFVFENYFKRIGFSKEKSYYSIKRLKKKICCCLRTNLKKKKKKRKLEKIPGTRNAQEHYQSFERKKKTKSVKQ